MRAISSVGQSYRLITGWSKVRALDGPPKKALPPCGAVPFLRWSSSPARTNGRLRTVYRRKCFEYAKLRGIDTERRSVFVANGDVDEPLMAHASALSSFASSQLFLFFEKLSNNSSNSPSLISLIPLPFFAFIFFLHNTSLWKIN